MTRASAGPSILLAAVVFLPMLLEARRSRRHERRLRAQGAVEPPRDVYPLMQVTYPACFLAMLIEGTRRRPTTSRRVVTGAVMFAAAKGLKYWAIAALGERWTFRVLVPPGAPLIVSGPYRWMRHPNYLAVMGELAGCALLANAPVTGSLSAAGFGRLILARIAVEERALVGK